jgi:uncharacterized membrane protein
MEPDRTNIANWERVLSVALGAAAVAHAIRARRVISLGTIGGLALIARGISGFCPVYYTASYAHRGGDTRTALGGARGIRLKMSVRIHRPPDQLYRLWRDLEGLPRFISNLETVERREDSITHWRFRGPGGLPVEWDAEIINDIEPDLIAWRSLPGADLVSAGSVRFRPVPGASTDVIVTMQYDPPFGRTGAALSWIVGRAPRSELREDLRRFKLLCETGEMPTSTQPPSWPQASRSDVAPELDRA